MLPALSRSSTQAQPAAAPQPGLGDEHSLLLEGGDEAGVQDVLLGFPGAVPDRDAGSRGGWRGDKRKD